MNDVEYEPPTHTVEAVAEETLTKVPGELATHDDEPEVAAK